MDTILLTGKTDLFPLESLKYIGEMFHVLVTGRLVKNREKNLPAGVRALPVEPSDSDFQKVFEIGSIKAVWHIGSCADGGHISDETADIEKILNCCARYGIPRLVVLTEPGDPVNYRKLISKWTIPGPGASPVDIAAVYLPLITGSGSRGRTNRIFSAMRRQKTICLEGNANRQISVLSISDLCALLMRMTDETWFNPGIYTANGSLGQQERLREILLSIRPDARIIYLDDQEKGRRADQTDAARFRIPSAKEIQFDGSLGEIYRLPISPDWDREILAQYNYILENSSEKTSAGKMASGYLKQFGKAAATVLDLVVMFVIAEYLARITSDSVYFKIVDVRLLFVILMGLMHGLVIGTVAAVLECIMLVIRYSAIGISGLLLFYNVENWIPFVYYLTAGIICGYTHQKHVQQMKSVSTENDLIRNKYLFLNEAYRASVSDKRELREQVLSEEESYSRLYSAMRQMSQRTPEAVCVEAVNVFRRILNNNTVFVYELEPGEKKADLLPFCRENASGISLSMDRYPEMMQVISKGGTWKNTGFLEGAPMYASLIRYRRSAHAYKGVQDIALIVTIEQADQNQLNLWYMNHFSVMCGLLKDALENASLRERVLE